MPTLAVRVESALDGRPLPGQFIEQVASVIHHVDVRLAPGDAYLLTGIEGIARIRALVVTVTQAMTVILNNAGGFGIPLATGGLLVFMGTSLTAFPLLRITNDAVVMGNVRAIIVGEPA